MQGNQASEQQVQCKTCKHCYVSEMLPVEWCVLHNTYPKGPCSDWKETLTPLAKEEDGKLRKDIIARQPNERH